MARQDPSGSDHGGGVKARLREELHKYLAVSGYLYVCFVAIVLFKMAVLRDAGVAYLPLGLAAAKALILGKFVLIGEATQHPEPGTPGSEIPTAAAPADNHPATR